MDGFPIHGISLTLAIESTKARCVSVSACAPKHELDTAIPSFKMQDRSEDGQLALENVKRPHASFIMQEASHLTASHHEF